MHRVSSPVRGAASSTGNTRDSSTTSGTATSTSTSASTSSGMVPELIRQGPSNYSTSTNTSAGTSPVRPRSLWENKQIATRKWQQPHMHNIEDE